MQDQNHNMNGDLPYFRLLSKQFMTFKDWKCGSFSQSSDIYLCIQVHTAVHFPQLSKITINSTELPNPQIWTNWISKPKLNCWITLTAVHGILVLHLSSVGHQSFVNQISKSPNTATISFHRSAALESRRCHRFPCWIQARGAADPNMYNSRFFLHNCWSMNRQGM
jgi:hypothetical protein